jgi:hypothetical protein
MPKNEKRKTYTKCPSKNTQEHSTNPTDHGSFSNLGFTSLGEEGGPTMIGEGRGGHHIPLDENYSSWYGNDN